MHDDGSDEVEVDDSDDISMRTESVTLCQMNLQEEYYKSDDYISHTDTKRNLLEFVYQSVRQIALKKKIKLINSFNSEANNLLDIGCGTGDFLECCFCSSSHLVSEHILLLLQWFFRLFLQL